MRRLMALALSAGVVVAPISVSTAQSETEPKPTTDVAEFVGKKIDGRKTDMRQLTRAAKRGIERRAEKRAAKRAEQAEANAIASAPAHLQAIAQCESGGDPTAVSADGTYRGLFQFDYGTWASVGGTGDPAAAPVAEQYKRATILYARSGAAPWPVCGA